MFKEEGSVAYTMINGKRVPVVKCETEVVLRNTRTNQEYNSDKEAEDDVNDVNTDTKQEDLSRTVKIRIAKMPDILSDSSS